MYAPVFDPWFWFSYWLSVCDVRTYTQPCEAIVEGKRINEAKTVANDTKFSSTLQLVKNI